MLEFLLLDRLFPRSVFHALTVGEDALARLEPPAQRNGRGPATTSAPAPIGRVLADLEFLPARASSRACRSGCTGSSGACPTSARWSPGSYFATAAVVGWSLEESPRR